MEIQKKDLQAELNKINKLYKMRNITAQDIINHISDKIAHENLSQDHKRKIMCDLVDVVLVFDGYVTVNMDFYGYADTLDGAD